MLVVIALLGAGLGSTMAGAVVATFIAVADARVQESAPETNYATVLLRVDAGADPDVESYLRFNVGALAGPVTSAKLRLWVTNATNNGPAV